MRHWHAETMFAQLAPGTAFLVFEVGTDVYRPLSFTAGDTFTVALGGESPRQITGQVEKAASGSATIALSDGSKWIITPRTADEPATGIRWTGQTGSAEWVIRSVA